MRKGEKLRLLRENGQGRIVNDGNSMKVRKKESSWHTMKNFLNDFICNDNYNKPKREKIFLSKRQDKKKKTSPWACYEIHACLICTVY